MISALDHIQNFTARKWLYREYMIYKQLLTLNGRHALEYSSSVMVYTSPGGAARIDMPTQTDYTKICSPSSHTCNVIHGFTLTLSSTHTNTHNIV